MLNDPQLESEPDARRVQGQQNAAQEWLSIRQLQDLLGIGHTKAYSLVASGEIPSVKIGRIIRITAILIRVDPASNSQRGRTNLPHLQA